VDHLRRLASDTADGNSIAVVMGRKAWRTLPVLAASPRRLDIVVTRDATRDVPGHVHRASSFDAAVGKAVAEHADRVYVLGGGELYREALGHFRCTGIHYTRVEFEFPGADTFFPEFEADVAWTCAPTAMQHHDNGFDYRIERWSRFAR
jgi:dihydrofolate reductase